MFFDYIVVGSGLFGSIFAHEMKKDGFKVAVIEKRNHIGGNCFTENIEGVNVHKYGPHIFHTDNDEIWNYINQFAKFNNFVNRPKVSFENQLFSFPINLMTLYQLWGVRTPAEAKERLEKEKVHFENPNENLETWILSQVGRDIYEKFIKGYTTKQWGREPKDLPASIIKRLPIRLTFDDNYFNDKHQGIPIGGYTQIFEKLLDGIEVLLETDFLEKKSFYESVSRKIVYTGKIDELFEYSLGRLEYRSLRFVSYVMPGDFQGNAVVNYTEEKVAHTRICEHKHFDNPNNSMTVVTHEYPDSYDDTKIPYYPIGDEKNVNLWKSYRDIASLKENYIFGGRLAEYKYFDMHQIIGSALKAVKLERIKNGNETGTGS